PGSGWTRRRAFLTKRENGQGRIEVSQPPAESSPMPALRSFWDHQVLRPAATAHRLSVGGRAVLFDDRAQQLFEPNDSAAAIWDALAWEGTPAGAARLLAGNDD